ncbi:MAG: response regulator transcription factor [Anaerolineales bacterium]|nr:response regulator transcription factor [Anaerolineales bacterium]
MTRIMIVDDEPLITDSLTYSLQREGFEVSSVGDGAMALQAIEDFQPELVVLDILLPGMSGFEICRRLRTKSNVPVIMLTARGEEIDRVLGLEVGADDYLSKPFSFRELLARIRAILRRVEIDRQATPAKSLEMGKLNLDAVARRVHREGKELILSAREFDLLSFFMNNAGRALSREELLAQVWGDDWVGDPRTLDVHIRWLRLKIEDDPASPAYIQTVRGHGYRFAGPEELA